MKIQLIRHPAPLIKAGICYGRLDVGVDAGAAHQTAALATDPVLNGAACVWTSPARRCRGLADAIALALGVAVIADPRLQELDFGAWEGQPWETVGRGDLDRWAASPVSFAPPGGESGAALVARVTDFYSGLVRYGRNCVVVSHGGPLKILSALLLAEAVDLLAAAPPIGSVRIVPCASPGRTISGVREQSRAGGRGKPYPS